MNLPLRYYQAVHAGCGPVQPRLIDQFLQDAGGQRSVPHCRACGQDVDLSEIQLVPVPITPRRQEHVA